MRAASFVSLSIYLVLGCVDRSQVSETGETDTSDTDTPTETSSGEAGTESGGGELNSWVYESPVQPYVLDASADGVIVGGIDSDSDNDKAVVYALDTLGDLLWTSEWDENQFAARSVESLAWTPGATWVGLYYGSCGDWCSDSGIARLDPQGVEQVRVDFSLNILEIEALDGDAIVLANASAPWITHLYRLGSDGAVAWSWIGESSEGPLGDGLEIVDGDIWVFGSLGTFEPVAWLGRYAADTGELMQDLQPELAPGSGHTTRLADGLAVTSGGGVAALALDGTSAWHVQLPDSPTYSSCDIDGDAMSVLLGCPTQLQLRDRDGALLSIWDELESTTDSYEWRDVALGTRVYAAIADSDAQLSGRVHGIPLE